MSQRCHPQPVTEELVDDAAALLAARHGRHRAAWPALNSVFEDAATVRPLVTALYDESAAFYRLHRTIG